MCTQDLGCEKHNQRGPRFLGIPLDNESYKNARLTMSTPLDRGIHKCSHHFILFGKKKKNIYIYILNFIQNKIHKYIVSLMEKIRKFL